MNHIQHINTINKYNAKHYNPLPIIIKFAEQCWMTDIHNNKYLDMLSSYSAVNQGHRHPKIIQAAKNQLDNITLCSTAFLHDQLANTLNKICNITKQNMCLLMNSGAEAVETAIKLTRKWAYLIKKIPPDNSEIITFQNNFHGRTTTIVSFSSENKYKAPFGPLTPGFKIIPFNDINSLKKSIQHNTAAILIEPIQGEGGINIPHDSFLPQVKQLCEKHNILFIADEIQTGLGRTGKLFACDHYNIKPDILILGKALSGGLYPISAVCSNLLHLFKTGEHGSTYGANPLACAIANASIDVIINEKLTQNSYLIGQYLLQQLNNIKTNIVKNVRGKGLLIGVELTQHARPLCEKLAENLILCKETHDNIIRFAPPLIITKDEIDWAIPRIKNVLDIHS